jgi:hypothetical protein
MRNWHLILTCMILFMPHLIMAEWMLPFNQQPDQVINAAIVSPTAGQLIHGSVVIRGVRNYTPFEAGTPTPVPSDVNLAPAIPTSMPTPHATSTLIAIRLPPTITPLPTNPAEVSSSQVMLTLGKGAVFTIGFFALLGAYLGIRAILYDRK